MNRIRFATLAAVPVVTLLSLSATPARAEGPYLKLKAAKETVAVEEPVAITLTAVSTRTLALPAATVAVDDGQGFRERADLACVGEAAAARKLSPDKASVASCDIKLAKPGKARVRFEYRLPTGVVRSNAVSVEVREGGGPAAAK